MRAAILFLLALLCQAAWAVPPHLELDLRLDPASRQLNAEATLTLQADQLDLRLFPGLKLTRLAVDGRKQPLPHGPGQTVRLNLSGAGPHKLQLAYQGLLAPLAELDHKEVLSHLPPMADLQGSFLPAGSGWYPDPGEPFSYRLSLRLPAGQKGLVAGTLVKETTQKGYRAEFAFSQTAEGIDLMAGPYEVAERLIPRQGRPPLRLRTWFYPDMTDLAPGYLDDSARYIARYSELIGPYPFDAFSVVAAPLPTGFGMPSLTYLGRDVLRLPFIRATSLGHEVLHNWWGNGVIPDWGSGNWSEGLTAFMADYAYKEDQSEEAAREARLGWLRNLAAVPEAEDTALATFTSRRHGISSIVGYDKAAMVFLMLRDEIGAAAFTQGLRLFWLRHRFLRAGWADLERAFSEASGRDLKTFFQQWVHRAGAPRLKPTQARWFPGSLELKLEQAGPPYQLRVPLRLLAYPDKMETRVAEVKEASTRIVLPAPKMVQAVDLDPDYRLWRRVKPDDFPPILREVFVAPRTGLLLADMDENFAKAAAALAERVLDARPEPLQATGPGLPESMPVLIIGQTERAHALLARLGLPPPPAQLSPAKGSAQAWVARDEAGRPYAVVTARDVEALMALLRPLPHYGRQSWLVFEATRAVGKGIWPARAERIRVDMPTPLAK
jgi:hypothetical protein